MSNPAWLSIPQSDGATTSERGTRADKEKETCRMLLWANFISTLIHYSHNYFRAEMYPPVGPFVSPFAYRLGILLFWPPLTLGAYYGWLKLKEGRRHEALPYIVGHALLGATTPGHLLGGIVPWYAWLTIATDGIFGSWQLWFAYGLYRNMMRS